MLEVNDATEVSSEILQQLPCRVQLPEEWRDFFEFNGQTPSDYDDRRQFPRFYVRGKAILKLPGQLDCIYIKDVSRNSIAFLHYQQLFPRQRPMLLLPNGTQRRATIVRCRRIQTNCFECAAHFCDAVDDPKPAS
jgi:hypothetical protein